jgi:hypothetical protein
VIASLADLRAQVADEFNNTALAKRFPQFLAQAHAEIAQWAVASDLLKLVEDADVNPALLAFPEAYRFGCLARGCAFARDYEAAQIYEAQFQAELRRIGSSDLALVDGLQPSPSPSTTP